MFHELIEATLGQLSNKQKSVTRLFPDFFSNPEKVPGVISKGGVRLEGITEDRWNFKIHSGTEEGLWYDVVIRWKDLEKDVEKLVSDRRNWTKDKKRADLRKIAAKLFKSGNVELSCSCLTGDTKVPLLDGRTLTIEQILQEFGIDKSFWVYASDEKGDFIPAQAVCLGRTKFVNQLLEIELDNGQKIQCTEDHFFRIRDGSYQRADSLVLGSSLMPLYRMEQEPNSKFSQSYEKVLLNSKRDGLDRPIWKMTHRVVAETLLDSERVICQEYRTEKDSYLVVHHRDMNSHNNCPENLQWLGVQEHWKMHSNGDHANSVEGIKKAWSDPVWSAVHKESNRRAGKICLEKHPEQFKHDGNIEYTRSEVGKSEIAARVTEEWLDPQIRQKRCEGIKNTYTEERREAQGEYKKDWWKDHPEKKQEQAKRGSAVFDRLERDPKTGRVLKNHRVVSVRAIHLDSAVPVYDLSVKGYQNFALDAGVFVHNCPAQQFWGPAYQLTKKHAKYGDQEDRSPDIRNPKQYGQYCKHVQVLMRTLPFYKSTIANWLSKEFKDLIQQAEGTATQTAKRYQAAGQALRGRIAKESIQESLPPIQKDYLKKSKRYGHEVVSAQDVANEFFLLSDGTFVSCRRHRDIANLGWTWDFFLSSGVIRGVLEDSRVLALEKLVSSSLSSDQIQSLIELVALHNPKKIYIDTTSGNSTNHRTYEIQREDLGDLRQILGESIIQEAVATLPEPQQALLDKFGPATEEDRQTTSTYPGEEEYVKFWLLSNGTLIHVERMHDGTASKVGTDTYELLSSGAARILVNKNYLGVETPDGGYTREQRTALADLYSYYQPEELALEGEGKFPIKSSDHLRRMLGESMQEAVVPGKLPALQQKLLKACKLSGLVRSVIDSEPWIKFWILNDGTIVPVKDSHPDSCVAIGSNDVQMMKTGALRGHIDQDEDEEGGLLSIQIKTNPTGAQVATMKKLAYQYRVNGFTYDDWRQTEKGHDYSGPIKNPEEIEFIVEYGPEGLDEARKKAFGLQIIQEQAVDLFKNAVAKMVQESGLRTKDLKRTSYWLLPDGNAADLLVERSYNNLLLEKHGCLRVYINEFQNQLQLFGSKSITNEQRSWLRKLIVANQISVVEAENFGSSEWDEFGPDTPDGLVDNLVTFFDAGERK